MSRLQVRPAGLDDAAGLALVHVLSWRETYRGLMSDEVLDAPDFVQRRERMWSRILSEGAFVEHRVSIAESDGRPVGVSMSAPSTEADRLGDRQLFVLYLLSAHQGSGAGAALLDAVIAPDEDAVLWVADPNPRAQAFYRRVGFAADEMRKVEDGVTEIRMVRPGDR